MADSNRHAQRSPFGTLRSGDSLREQQVVRPIGVAFAESVDAVFSWAIVVQQNHIDIAPRCIADVARLREFAGHDPALAWDRAQ